MTMETDPSAVNDPLRLKKMEIISREADAYAESLMVSKKRNDDRASSRKRIADAGVDTDAYQDAIRLLKLGKTESERQAYLDDLLLCLQALGAKQMTLFPELEVKAKKQADKAAKKAEKKPSKKAAAAGESKGRGKDELDAKTDTDPKSAPKTIKESDQAVQDSLKAVAEREQSEGAEILDRTKH